MTAPDAPLTDEQIDDALKLCDTATPSPWRYGAANGGRYLVDANGYLFAQIDDEGNGVFIAAARTQLPAALRELKAARDSISALQPARDSQVMTNNDLMIKLQLSETREKQATEMCTWLTQENERLRNAAKATERVTAESITEAQIRELIEDLRIDGEWTKVRGRLRWSRQEDIRAGMAAIADGIAVSKWTKESGRAHCAELWNARKHTVAAERDSLRARLAECENAGKWMPSEVWREEVADEVAEQIAAWLDDHHGGRDDDPHNVVTDAVSDIRSGQWRAKEGT